MNVQVHGAKLVVKYERGQEATEIAETKKIQKAKEGLKRTNPDSSVAKIAESYIKSYSKPTCLFLLEAENLKVMPPKRCL